MSYIRALESGRYSNINGGVYVYPSGDKGEEAITFSCVADIDAEEFCEVMFRILERAEVKITLKLVNKAREEMFLPKLGKIKSERESIKEYLR